MKLKTKFQDEDFDLGEVVNANIYYGGSDRIKIVATSKRGGEHSFYYESLKGLNEMFEDYEEPKEIWYIDYLGRLHKGAINDDWSLERKIGNYFETKEEAEKAVKKLKALKRLKDKGFRFKKWESYEETSGLSFPDRHIVNSYTAIFDFNKPCRKYEIENEVKNDLDLLFGGEE